MFNFIEKYGKQMFALAILVVPMFMLSFSSAAVVVSNQLTGSNLTAVTDLFDTAGSVGSSGTYSLVLTVGEWLLVNVGIIALMIAVFFVWNWFRRRLSSIF